MFFVRHKIKLIPDNTGPLKTALSLSGPDAFQFWAEEIENIFKNEVIEPATTAWSSGIALGPVKNGSIRFWVHESKLDASKIWDYYFHP